MKLLKTIFVAGCLMLIGASSVLGGGYLYVTAPASGPQVGIATTSFIQVPDLALTFFQYAPGTVCINMSAECYTIGGKRMFIRALVDGQPASPSDVILVNGDFRGTHTFQFTANLQGGQHEVIMQYKVDTGGQGQFGDRTLWISTAPEQINTIAAASGPDVSTTSGSFQDIPQMSTNITLSKTGDLFVTMNAEAEITAGKRMFVRAVIDGQACKPSDVVFCASTFYGTRSFTFSATNISAGNHTVSMQWLVDGGATGYLGDRTMTIGFQDPTAAARDGVIASISAPSGAGETTTSSSYANIPNLSTTVVVPDNSHLCISACGEVYTTSGKRMFVRAMLDGQPVSPSNVVFTAVDFDGVYSFTFISRNVTGGSHQIAIQWMVDGGGTAFIGDRNMTIIAFGAPCPDLSSPFDDLTPADGDRNILAICWDPHRTEHPAPAFQDVKNLLFGSKPSVRDYYIVNSHNRVFLNDAGMKGWYNATKAADHYWGPEDPTDSNGDGWVHPHVEKWYEAVMKADPTFNFAAYDANGDKTLSPDELVVLMIIPQNSPFGTVRTPASKEYPTWQPLVVDGVTIPIIAEAYIGAPPDMGVVAHELGHALFNLPDEYFWFFLPYAAGAYSLMDATYVDSHLDPFLKIRLGWVQPAIVTTTGVIPIDAIEQSHVAYVLHDPQHSNLEYFIVENRQPGLAYDSNLPDAGLAVWHIMEDPAVYGNLPTPTGVNAADWASINPGDWGRRAIRMIRPIYGPPFDNRTALWDGSDPATGYDLLSTDSNPNHVTLKWADGTPSGFAIKNISASGSHMTALIEVPRSATDVFEKSAKPLHYGLSQNWPNPFNSSTSFTFVLSEPARVQVQIFNLAGQEVATLLDGMAQAGEKTITWNGKNNQDEAIATGVYICRCRTDKWMQTKKMALVR